MSIPLDQLYHYIDQVAKEIYKDDVIIYRFWPNGSKKLENLDHLEFKPWLACLTKPYVICNDQEPLDFDYYQSCQEVGFQSTFYDLVVNNSLTSLRQKNLYGRAAKVGNIFDQCILIHSEKRSQNLQKYLSTQCYIPVYYWSHALIARDWFRYAQYYNQNKTVCKKFLIYNRAWAGSREYRLKFAEYLVKHGLNEQCMTWFNSKDPETSKHYTEYDYKNLCWKPTIQIEKYFPPSSASSNFSAEFVINDYQNTDVEVVLETLFDDDRLHLTEKILRPIACGQPFILVSTHGSLDYLRAYGFKTFSDVWNENYDTISDPQQRLISIIETMKEISQWSDEVRKKKIFLAQKIAEHNRQIFFSQEFFNKIVDELKHNLCSALNELESNNTSKHFLERRKTLSKVSELRQILSGTVVHPDFEINPKFYQDYNRDNILKVIKLARKYYLRSLSQNNKKQ